MKLRGFEFEDQPWFPVTIRNSMTEYLRFLFITFHLYKPVWPLLKEMLIKTNNTTILDLCSGSGGAMEGVYQNLQQTIGTDVKIVLTDLFPSLRIYKQIHQRTKGGISYIASPVDACAVPSEMEGFRTMFSGFHHFQPAQAKAIFSNAIACQREIGIFDGGNKSIAMIMTIILVHPVMLFFCTPFIKPFRISRLIFTYLIPVIPFCTIWDGIVSIIRLYKPHEMEQIAREADLNNSYQWISGKVKNKYGMSIAYLVGTPFTKNN
ncbi:MAG: class I SAM-dependent methyltransferase [Candidatus Saccharibacteria bacterium]